MADVGNSRIQRFTANGNFVDQWGGEGSGEGQFDSPQDLAVANDGTVYVVDSGNNRIQRFTANGDFIDQWGSEGSGEGQFYFPSGIAMGSDGSIYVGDVRGTIQRFTADGRFLDPVSYTHLDVYKRQREGGVMPTQRVSDGPASAPGVGPATPRPAG